MSKLLLLTLLALVLLFAGESRAQAQVFLPFSPEAVIQTLNEYGTALNALVEYALPSTCNPAAINSAGLTAAATSLVQQFFSQNIKSYVVINQTAITNGFGIVTNYTVGAGQTATSILGQQVPIHTGAALNTFLQGYYYDFTAFFFSRPFWWTVDKPVVTAMNLVDPKFNGATTAYITLSDVNEGFACNLAASPPTRIYQKQQSIYRHVMVLEFSGLQAVWRFLEFEEINKNKVIFPQLPLQVQPPN